MQKQTTTQILIELAFIFGFVFSLLFFFIFLAKYPDEETGNIRVFEFIFILITMTCYQIHLFSYNPLNLKVIVIQGLVFFLLLQTVAWEHESLWLGVHIGCYVTSSIVWVVHLLWLKTLPKIEKKRDTRMMQRFVESGGI